VYDFFLYEFKNFTHGHIKMNKPRITIQIDEPLKQAIENTIKKHYPKFKTVSDVVRTALQQFLEEKHDN